MEKDAKCNDNKLSDLCQGGMLTVWKCVYVRAVFRGFKPPFIHGRVT